MANLDRVTTPDGQTYNIIDSTSGYVTSAYVQSQIDTINKNSIGLGNVDNTSDLNKPVSTAQQTAIDNAVAPKVNKTDIATVESGTTASRAYRVGELVYVSGTLCRVKTAIASGATFTVGTNVEVTNVSNEVKSSSDTTTYSYPIAKAGNVVVASIEFTPTTLEHGTIIASRLPKPRLGVLYMSLGMANGSSVPCVLSNVSGQDYAQLVVYYPTVTLTPGRIDATITYIAV